jgi:hypothetical protein
MGHDCSMLGVLQLSCILVLCVYLTWSARGVCLFSVQYDYQRELQAVAC